MSAEDIGFAPPPFNAATALQRVQRELRTLGLTERAGTFERRGVAIARLATDGTDRTDVTDRTDRTDRTDGTTLKASLVKKPSRNSPEWQHRNLASHADVSQFCALVKKQLAAWSDSDD